MTTYEIPAEPTTDEVWLTGHPVWPHHVLWARRDDDRWLLLMPNASGLRLSWAELLSLGTVTDVDPDDVSWLPPGPWSAHGGTVLDSVRNQVMTVPAKWPDDVNKRLASLVARLVNEHVARKAGESR